MFVEVYIRRLPLKTENLRSSITILIFVKEKIKYIALENSESLKIENVILRSLLILRFSPFNFLV